MENLKEFMNGADYSQKINSFDSAIYKIHNEYAGEFDVSRNYFTLIPQSEGKIQIVFDLEKEIPGDLKNHILDVFNEIWG